MCASDMLAASAKREENLRDKAGDGREESTTADGGNDPGSTTLGVSSQATN